VFTMAALAADSMVQLSFTLLTLGLVSALALFLGAVGLYGVLSCVVAERTREIGVRMALGARASDVLRMVVGQSAVLIAIGMLVGLAGGYGLARLMAAQLFGVTPTDPLTYATVTGTLLVTALFASWRPASRASRVDPIQALRGE
jgi:putative ABC transport system permease protein